MKNYKALSPTPERNRLAVSLPEITSLVQAKVTSALERYKNEPAYAIKATVGGVLAVVMGMLLAKSAIRDYKITHNPIYDEAVDECQSQKDGNGRYGSEIEQLGDNLTNILIKMSILSEGERVALTCGMNGQLFHELKSGEE